MSTDPTYQFGATPDPEAPFTDGPLPSTLRPGRSALEALRSELAAEVTLPMLDLQTPGRPQWHARYNPDIDHEALEAWRKASRDKSKMDGVNSLALCQRILVNTNVGLLHSDTVALDDEGEPLTFRHPDVIAMTPGDAVRPMDVVRWWYVSDGFMFAAASAIMEAAGYGADTLGVDPTNG